MTGELPQSEPGPRRTVLMLCAHEPTMDPRIRWEAEGAGDRFDVVVVGFDRGDGSQPAVERCRGYTIHRLPHPPGGVASYAVRLVEALDGFPRLALLAVGALALVPVAVADLALRSLQALARSLKKRVSRDAALVRAIRSTGILGTLRETLQRILIRTRLAYVLAALRVQFAPATQAFWRFVYEMPRRPDVVHCNDLDTLLVGVLAKKRFGCRLVYDAHEYYPHSDPEGGWLDRAVFAWLEANLARRADAVVTVNHRLATVMQDAYGLRRVVSVPNAEPWSEIGASPPSAMTRLAAGRVRFLFQGRFSPGRGLEEVLRAFAKVDASRAALFLRGPDNPWRHELRTLAEQLGVLDRSVYFLDPVVEDALVAAASEADVGWIPYKGDVAGYKYACPNKLSQYLHAGLLVLTNDLPYVREVIEEAGAGLHYRCEDPDSIVHAVRQVVEDPDLLQRGKENARRYARETFNWQVFSEALYRVYGERSGPTGGEPALAASGAS